MSSSDEALLRIVEASRSYGGLRALDGATLTIQRQGITGIIGPNGAGKSTLVGAVGGQIALDSGEIVFEGERIDHLPSHRRAQRRLIRTFQVSSQFDRLTVLENLLLGAPSHRGERLLTILRGKRWWRDQEWELIDEAIGLLKRFEMFHKADEYAGMLSGGQKRLVEIMRALMAHPRLLLLDEPMAGVSPALIPTIEASLLEVAAGGVALVMLEHEMGIVERLCREVIVMARGQVIAVGPFAEVRDREDVVNAFVMG